MNKLRQFIFTLFAAQVAALPIVTKPLTFFNHWHCVGISSKIPLNKPYSMSIGELPLVVWKDAQDQWISTVNICKHMGSTLDKGKITSAGCLKCPYHGLEMTRDDEFGKIVECDGKLFWSYSPAMTQPYVVPFQHNKEYKTSYLEMDMDASLPDSAYNTMDLRHPEFVHGNAFGFGSNIPPTNIRNYVYMTSRDRIALSFDYKANKLISKINRHDGKTHNFHMYMYPGFSWSRVTFDETKHLFIGVHLLPLGPSKTRWYITIRHNYYTSTWGQELMQLLATTILSQDRVQMRLQSKDSGLKRAVLFQHTFPDEDAILWLKSRLSEYVYPSIELCGELYQKHKGGSSAM